MFWNAPQGDMYQISVNAPLRFEFSESMNQGSVENAFTLSPERHGDFVWENPTSFVFEPKDSFVENEVFEVQIGTGAKNKFGKHIKTNFSQKFTVVGPPRVQLISPISSAEWDYVQSIQNEITSLGGSDPSSFPSFNPHDSIVLVFNRPLVFEKQVSQFPQFSSNFSDVIHFSPSLSGKFQLLSTHVLEFIPEEQAFPFGNTLTATISTDNFFADGSHLDQEIIWHLETEEPKILGITPEYDSENIAPTSRIQVTWNQAVESQSFFNHLSITPDLPSDTSRNLKVEWDQDRALNTFFVSFDPYFPKSAEVHLTVSPGVKSGTGNKVSTAKSIFSFMTLSDFRMTAFWPKEKGAMTTDNAMALTFNRRVLPEQVLQHLSFSPDIAPENMDIKLLEEKKGEYTYQIHAPFLKNQQYTWFIDSALQSESFPHEVLAESVQEMFTVREDVPEFRILSPVPGKHVSAVDLGGFVEITTEHRNFKGDVSFSVCKISEDELIQHELNISSLGNPCTDGSPRERTLWKASLDSDSHPKKESIPFPETLEIVSGIYAYEASFLPSEDPLTGIFAVTESEIVLKQSLKSLLLWATDFQSGKPMSNMEFHIFAKDADTFTLFDTLLSDTDGLASVARSNETHQEYFILGKKNGAFASFAMSPELINESALLEKSSPSNISGFLTSDRFLYQPNDHVFFTGALRQREGSLFQFSEAEEVTVVLQNESMEEFHAITVPVDKNGAFWGSISLDSSLSSGEYFLSGNVDSSLFFSKYFFIGDIESGHFSEIPFEEKKTSPQLTVAFDQEEYSVGDTAELFVVSPFLKPVHALFSLEQEDILETQILTLNAENILEIPVLKNLLPSTTVSISAVQGKENLNEFQDIAYQKMMTQRVIFEKKEEEVSLQKKWEVFQKDLLILPFNAADLELRQATVREETARERLVAVQEEIVSLEKESGMLEEEIQKLGDTIPEEQKASLLSRITSGMNPVRFIPKVASVLTSLPMSTKEKKIDITLEAKNVRINSQNIVRMNIKTKDVYGTGVPSHISVFVTDTPSEKIRHQDVGGVFWSTRFHDVQTSDTLGVINSSAPKQEHVQEKTEIFPSLHTHFVAPNISTDENGRSEFSFLLPGESTEYTIYAIALTDDTLVGEVSQDFRISNSKLAEIQTAEVGKERAASSEFFETLLLFLEDKDSRGDEIKGRLLIFVSEETPLVNISEILPQGKKFVAPLSIEKGVIFEGADHELIRLKMENALPGVYEFFFLAENI